MGTATVKFLVAMMIQGRVTYARIKSSKKYKDHEAVIAELYRKIQAGEITYEELIEIDPTCKEDLDKYIEEMNGENKSE